MQSKNLIGEKFKEFETSVFEPQANFVKTHFKQFQTLAQNTAGTSFTAIDSSRAKADRSTTELIDSEDENFDLLQLRKMQESKQDSPSPYFQLPLQQYDEFSRTKP